MAEQSTIAVYPLDGTNRKFVVPYEYLARRFVTVTLLGTDRKPLVLGTDFRFISANQIETTQAWGDTQGYANIEVRRKTSATQRLVDFYDGSVLRARDLNVSAIQTIHIAEEARNLAGETLAENLEGNLDARFRKMVNLGVGTDDFDAVTVGQMKTWSASALNQANRSESEADRSQGQATWATQRAAAALASQNAAKVSETNSKTSETNAKTSETNSKASETNSKASETNSKTSETNSKASELAAEGFAAEAEQSAQAAAQSASQSDAYSLRQDLANPDIGAALVAFGQSSVAEALNSRVLHSAAISDLRDLEPEFDGQQVELLGHTVKGIGGGTFYADSSSLAVDDNGVTIVTAEGNRWVRRFDGSVRPEFFGAIGDGVTDDGTACNAAIQYFKSLGVPITEGLSLGGRGLDWSGATFAVSRTLDLTGLSFYAFYGLALKAVAPFTGDALVRVNSDGVWYANSVYLSNPVLDGNWIVDICLEAYDFAKLTVAGGMFTHYRKKGILTGRKVTMPHELILAHTFFFQREWNEEYPADITEGEAFEINNPDNELTSVTVGYQKQWAGTLNDGSNTVTAGHFYTGHVAESPTGGLRSFNSQNTFMGCFFDYTWLSIQSRTIVTGCRFWYPSGTDTLALKISVSGFDNKVTANTFRKSGGASTPAILVPTMAEGRTGVVADIHSNIFENCGGNSYRSVLYVAMSGHYIDVPVPDHLRPVANFGPITTRGGDNTQDHIYTSSLNSTGTTLTIKCWAVGTNGELTPATGRQARVPFNHFVN